MKDDKWQKISEILDEALDLETDEQGSFIREACSADPELEREVLSLLKATRDSQDFLEQPAVTAIARDLITPKSKIKEGQQIGQYTVVRELGKGGQGTVYEAIDTKLDRRVALKMLPEELAINDVARKRFQREAQLASALVHANICTVHDLIEVEGRHFIVMQFVSGRSVRELVNGHPLQLKSALKIVIQVCDALAAAHLHGIIHRDIKAQNIVVSDTGQPKILDFGLAKLYLTDRDDDETQLTVRGSPYGTPTYAAPEQSRGENVDHRADIFSTGVLLYEMLTGTWAFHGKTAVDVRHAVLHQQPRPVAGLRGEDIPEELQQIVDRALAKDASERYQDVVEMRDSLITVLRGLPESETSDTANFLDGFSPLTPRHLRQTSRATRIALMGTIILAVATFGFVFAKWWSAPSRGQIRSLAVLPFKPLTPGGDQFLELGMADTLITRLMNLKQISVRPTNSIMKYMGAPDAAAAGRELGVDAVLDGHIQRDNDKLRVTYQLIRAGDGEVLATGKFDEEFKSIFALQDAIAERLASDLAMKLEPEERQRLVKRSTDNPDAYQAYTKGRFFWNKFSGQASDKSVEFFQDAIRLDPNYAAAYAGLADAYQLQGYLGAKPSKVVFPLAQENVNKALALDPQLGEAHLVQAEIDLFYNWDTKAALSEIEAAVRSMPNDAGLHGFHGVYWVVKGDLEKALAERQRMQELDPTNPFAALNLGWSYFYSHDYDHSIEQYKRALELDPQYALAYESIGNSYLRQGRQEEGFEALMQSRTLSGAPPDRISTLREAFRQGGIGAYWRAELEVAQQHARDGKPAPRRLARIYTELSDHDNAFLWLNRSVDEHSPLMVFLKTDPTFDALRGDPRFTLLLQRIGLI